MANVGKLNVIVGASAAGMKTGLSSAAQAVTGFAGEVKSSLGGIAGALGVGLTAVGLKSWIGGAMDTIKNTALMAKTLHIGTEQFSELGYAASKSGTNAETLAIGLGKMEKTIGLAESKGGAAAKVFEDIGLSVSDLASSTPDQAFLKISDAIRGIQDPFAQAAAITQIFGKGGLDLSIMLNKGSDAIIALGAHAKSLGVAFSDVDAAAIKEATIGWKEMKSVVEGLSIQFAVALAPGLKMVTENLPTIGLYAKATFSVLGDELAFFVGNWELQWELIKVDAAIFWNTYGALSVGVIDGVIDAAIALGKDFAIVFQQMGASAQAFAVGAWAAIKAAFSGENPLSAFGDAFRNSLTESLAGIDQMTSVGDAFGDAFTAGFKRTMDPALDAERNDIVSRMADMRSEFDAMSKAPKETLAGIKDVTKALPEFPFAGGEHMNAPADWTTVGQGASLKLAGASQFGTSEAATQINAAIAGKAGKDDAIANHTERTANGVERVADAVEKLQFPEFESLDEFS